MAVRCCQSALLLLLLTAAASVSAELNCDLTDEAALSECVRATLLSLSDKVQQKSDPLRLPDRHERNGRLEWRLNNIWIRGLASYNIPHLQISFPEPIGERLKVQATIGWPNLRGELDGKVSYSRKIFGKRLRASVKADVTAHLTRPTAQLDVTMRLNVGADGRIAAVPENTRVVVSLPGIRANVRPHGFSGLVNKLIGNPASKYASKVSNEWWRDNKARVEQRAKKAVEEAIVEKLGVELSKLLH